MGRAWVNSLAEFDLSTLRLSDIDWKYGTGTVISSGEGRNKTYRYRNGVMTDLGDIEEHLWYSLVEHIAQRDSEAWLVDALTDWEKEHNYVKDSSAQLRNRALKHYAARSFDHPQWIHYIPFNRRFRPDILAGAHIVTVVNACCKNPGGVTQEQIDRAYGGTVACPHCGRWSAFSIASGEEPPWEEF